MALKRQNRKKTPKEEQPPAADSVKPILPAKAVVDRATEIAAPLCASQGIELVHVEYRHESQGQMLRVYIDKPGGVKLDDCVRVSRELGDSLDVHLETGIPYHLEVSSPGTDRPLVKESDYERFKGEVAMIRTTKPLEGRKNFKGVLLGITEGEVQVDLGNQIVSIPHRDITRGRLVTYYGDKRC
ncbi:MAG: ribosome maturation factor RimP [Thermodesulfobacteriota bacterium]